MQCITFSFLTVIHAFYMCAYYVKMLCVGRIGLGWTHDVFTIACHIFTHFSCICTFIYFYFYFDIDLCCCFSACLSFSPFFFLSVSCSMAPKRKSTPSRNSLHSEASSSFSLADSTPSYIWFRDDKACKDFSENFSRCSIHSKHQVILLDFSDTDLSIVIYSKSWESLCGIPVTCPSVII